VESVKFEPLLLLNNDIYHSAPLMLHFKGFNRYLQPLKKGRKYPALFLPYIRTVILPMGR
jgi:hypothetical protein